MKENEENAAPFELSQLDAECVAASQGWNEAVHWHWVDAVAWIARRSPELMALLRGYRHLLERELGSPNEEGCEKVALSRVPRAEWKAAERLLRLKLGDGLLNPITVAGEPAKPADWAASDDWVDKLLGSVPAILVRRDGVVGSWPYEQNWEVSSDRAGSAERDEECRRVAALLDSAGIPKRRVRSSDIAERWNPAKGKPLSIDSVTVFMAGGERGRPAI